MHHGRWTSCTSYSGTGGAIGTRVCVVSILSSWPVSMGHYFDAIFGSDIWYTLEWKRAGALAPFRPNAERPVFLRPFSTRSSELKRRQSVHK